MAKFKRNAVFFLLILCFVLTLHLPAAAAADPEPNLVRYVPQGTDGVHTIHWAAGITPPTIPGQLTDAGKISAADADFQLIDSFMHVTTPETNSTPEEYYVSKYLPGNGWYDINKHLGEGIYDDSSLCFVTAASNAIEWWLDQNREAIEWFAADPPQNPGMADLSFLGQQFLVDKSSISQDPMTSPVYQVLRDQFYETGTHGGYPDDVMDAFFNGYPAVISGDRNSPETFVPNPKGGFFHPVFGKSILSDVVSQTRYTYLNSNFRKELDAGNIPVLAYSYLGPGSAHAVTLWGAEYDETDQLCAVYITDSNDYEGEPFSYFHDASGTHLIGMIRYQIYCASNGMAKITTLKNPNDQGSPIIQYFLLTSADEGWKHFLKTGTPLYPDGRAFLSPMIPSAAEPSLGSPECLHEFVYTAEGNRITETCLHCHYRQWLEVRPRTGANFVYDGGNPVKPFAMYASPNWRHAGQLNYFDNCNAGTARVVMHCKGQQVQQNFIIEKANQLPPEPPVLEKADDTAITLKTGAELEFSMDRKNWQTAPVFSGLMPETDYTFYARKAESQNYLPSQPSPGVSFRTAEAPPEFTVTLDARGGTGVPEQITTVGGTLEVLPVPVRESHIFLGWFTGSGDPAADGFRPHENLTLYARWAEDRNGNGLPDDSESRFTVVYTDGVPNAEIFADRVFENLLPGTATPVPEPLPARTGWQFAGWDPEISAAVTESAVYSACWEEIPMPFTDVSSKDWFYNSVRYAYFEGLILGTAPDHFDPEGITTRGMIVAILHRLEGEPKAALTSFPDVSPTEYYAEPIAWAAQTGLVLGYENGCFGPEDPVTRQQMAAILHRYARMKGMPADGQAELTQFRDYEKIEPYAEESLSWALTHKIMIGVGNQTLDPKGTAQRAQTAAMLMRLLQGDSNLSV